MCREWTRQSERCGAVCGGGDVEAGEAFGVEFDCGWIAVLRIEQLLEAVAEIGEESLHVHPQIAGAVRGEVASRRGVELAGAAEIAGLEVKQGDGRLDQSLVELLLFAQNLRPELFEDVVAVEELPGVEQANAFQIEWVLVRHWRSSQIALDKLCRFDGTIIGEVMPRIEPRPARSREAFDEKKKRARRIVRKLAKAYPDAVCALRFESPYQLVVATILSAQCTDERVNMTTPELFRRYPDFEALAGAKQADLEALIKSTGFFRAKATNLRAMARGVVERHGGELPRTLEEMVELPGVGRKTANVVLGTAFELPTGVVVDTHVKRVTHRLGLTESTNPAQIERGLMELIPKKEWINFSHRLIHHGRRICTARKPKCRECPLLADCGRVGLPPL